MLNNSKSAEFAHMEHIARNAANNLITELMDYNTTVVNSIQNIYPTAYLSNSSNTLSSSSIVELHKPLSPQVVIHV